METNNAEIIETTQTTETTDTNSIPDVSAVEAEQSALTEVDANAEADVTTGEEAPDQTSNEEESIYLVGDKEITLSRIEELEKGNMLQADYTKKRQVDAEARKVLDADQVKVSELKTSLSETIEKLESSIKAEFDPEEMDYLRQNDTGEYLKRKDEAAEKAELAKKAKADLDALKAEEENARVASEQQKLLKALPEWADSSKYEADKGLIEGYVKDADFSDNDYQALSSHKLMIMALDAAKYHKLKAKTAETEKAVQAAPNVIKASVKQKKTAPKSDAQLFYSSK